MADEPLPERPSYFKAAFWNVYNVTSLAGIGAAALLTTQPWLLAMGVAAETLWLLFAPDNKRFQRAINAQYQKERQIQQLLMVRDQVQFLPSPSRDKAQTLQVRADEIKVECRKNPKLQGEFMGAQLDKLDGLVAEYVHLAVVANRCQAYLAKTDAKRLIRERDQWQAAVERARDDTSRGIAEQNKAVLEKRLAINQQLALFTEHADGQMSLIENTVSLLRDQVMTMATPEALTGQLDELVTSVEAIGDSVRDAEAVVSSQVALSDLATDPEELQTSEMSPERGRSTRVRN
jgi:hypothetical protein